MNGSSGSHSVWNGTEYWHGSFMYIPGTGDQELLTRSVNFKEAPDGLTSSYPIVTRHNWTVSCLPTLAPGNESFGEGFLAIAPDGTQYRFDWLVSRPLTPLKKASAGPEMFKTSSTSAAKPERANERKGKPVPEPTAVLGNFLSRSEVWILPTRVTDRFGNSVIYEYDMVNKWQLKKIVSDEANGSARTLSLTYASPSSSNVASVSDGVRTWNYAYDAYGRLSTVLQPDGSMWQLEGIVPLLSEISYLGNGNCDTPGILNTYPASGFMVHPSGARGDFTLSPTRHSRAAVPYECLYDVGTETYWARHYSVFDTYSLTTKAISGPGLSRLEWSISYPDPEPSWAPCNECIAMKKVASVDPSGAKTVYTFGMLFQATEGELQQTDVFDSANTLLRTTKLRYSEPRMPYGTTDQRRGDGLLATRMREVVSRIISQQGVDFEWTLSIFDNSPFVRPSRIRRSSGLDRRSEDTKYWDNKSKWIISQVEQVTEPASGHVMIRNIYDPVSGAVLEKWRYGVREQTLTYNSFVFNQDNRMTSAPGKATYGYDGLGRRVSTVGTDGVNRVQVYSQEGQLMYAGPTGSTDTNYIYLHNHVLAEVDGAGTTYSHTDGLGSPVAQTNLSGVVVSRTRYEPYGHATDAPQRTIGFTGHAQDNDTGLIYMQQRYYDPFAGRLLSIDPVTTDASTGNSFNRYSYAGNNPYKYVDPDGGSFVHAAAFVLGAGIDIYAQAYGPGGKGFSNTNFDFKSAAIAGVSAMITGGVAGKLAMKALQGSISAAKATVTTTAVGSAAAGAGSAAGSLANGETPHGGKVMVSMVGGALGAGLGAKLANAGAATVNSLSNTGGVMAGIGATTQSATNFGANAMAATSAGQQIGTAATDVSSTLATKRAEQEVSK